MDDLRVGITFRSLNGLYYTTTQVPNTTNADGASLTPMAGSKFYSQDPVLNANQTPLSNTNGVIQMPLNLALGDCHIMAEYIYLDQNEANRFRLADLQIPVVQHYAINPQDTQGLMNTRIRLDIPNPCRDLYFMCNPYLAPSYNAHFLATRTLTGSTNSLPNNGQTPWWPDAVGLSSLQAGSIVRPAFALSQSEPLSGYELDYQGSLVRWVNRYYYNIPLAIQNGFTPFSKPQGEANLDKITQRDLILQFKPTPGLILSVPRYTVYTYAETYNMLRVYGGRGGLMFAY
jgi:hypothetical protein